MVLAPALKNIIIDPLKDPLGSMMLDYLGGDHQAFVTVESDAFDMWEMTGKTMFRTFGQMNRIERKALGLCKGTILDIGAGAGCHSLYLQNRQFKVTALDHSIGCVQVLKKRKVKTVVHDNLFALPHLDFHTLLMLMNGIGIVGSLDGLHLFFQFIRDRLPKNSQVLIDSTDLADLYDPSRVPLPKDQYYGETQFVMQYKDCRSDPFDWLYIDFQTLTDIAGTHGFHCEKIIQDRSEKYLAKLWRAQ